VQPDLLKVLADPEDGSALSMCSEGAELVGGSGRRYSVRNGIPRFVLTKDEAQRQTEASFGFKWSRRDTYDSPAVWQEARRWLSERYGFPSTDAMGEYLARKGSVLDAGCGSGFSSSLWLRPRWSGSMWVGVDISGAIDVAAERLADIGDTHFVQGDVVQPPFRPGSFDVVFSEGVLHHTPSTERAFKAVVPLLKQGGEMMAYVYRRKGPIREFTDDYVRDQIAGMPPAEAWEALRPLTRLGQALAELQVDVEIPEDVPLLGIKAGRYDVQRLFYWHVAKAFWKPMYSFEENHHINFDWYHPRYAHRHTAEEIRSWLRDCSLDVIHFDEQESGYTVRALKAH
jgi:arsenite methyltransferase